MQSNSHREQGITYSNTAFSYTYQLGQKEIWEDEGIVVISRNVDVLVSKLRKKLGDDSSFKFINVHGRGYKFIIE